MEQPEGQRADNDSELLAVDREPVDQRAAEQEFLDAGGQHHKEQRF